MPQLLELDISDSRLGDLGGEEDLSIWFKHVPTLQHLILSTASLTVTGMLALATVLTHLTGLRSLNLNGVVELHDDCADTGVDCFQELMGAAATLTSMVCFFILSVSNVDWCSFMAFSLYSLPCSFHWT